MLTSKKINSNFINSGFTIIEVLLFLAITGLVFLVGFAGIRGSFSDVQFTDSMRSLHSYINKEISQVTDGLNIRSDNINCIYIAGSPGGGSSLDGKVYLSSTGTVEERGKEQDCLILGRYFAFDNGGSQIDTSIIVGKNPEDDEIPSDNSDISLAKTFLDDGKIAPARDLFAESGSELVFPYDIEWGTQFVRAKSLSTGDTYDNLLLFRSPNSTRLMGFVNKSQGANALSNPDYLHIGTDITGGVVYCFRGANGSIAGLNIGLNGKNDIVELVFEDSNCL